MGMLFRNSDLELRFSLNMNVLIDGLTPKVCSRKDVLRAFLDHRQEVLVRRSGHRLAKIDHRLEVLEGFILAFLNLDRVIDIIRYDTDPKTSLMFEDWARDHPRAMAESDYVGPQTYRKVIVGQEELSEIQAEAILNMRLRSLRRLEEIELRRERDDLQKERANLDDLLEDVGLQWSKIAEQLRATRRAFGKDYKGGSRRTVFAEVDEMEEVPLEAMIEREPVTIVCSKMGWIRAMSGHLALDKALKYKDGDEAQFIFHAETTDKLIAFGSNGRFFTILAANLPGGRGMGEPLRLMIDLPNEAEIIDLFIYDPKIKRLVASTAGDGFVVNETEIVAQTRSGRQVLNVKGETKALTAQPIQGKYVACIGENRKMLVFDISELPEMNRGKGVRLQKYKDGGLSDVTTFSMGDGLSWKDPAERTRTVEEAELQEWIGKRASAGRMAPRGFPRDNCFK